MQFGISMQPSVCMDFAGVCMYFQVSIFTGFTVAAWIWLGKLLMNGLTVKSVIVDT